MKTSYEWMWQKKDIKDQVFCLMITIAYYSTRYLFVVPLQMYFTVGHFTAENDGTSMNYKTWHVKKSWFSHEQDTPSIQKWLRVRMRIALLHWSPREKYVFQILKGVVFL